MYELPPRPLEPPRLFRVGRGADHRDRLLELDHDAAAGGVFDGLLGQVVEIVVPQAAAGRSQGKLSGELRSKREQVKRVA